LAFGSVVEGEVLLSRETVVGLCTRRLHIHVG